MAGKGVNIGSGYVDINADMTDIDNAMAALPKKTSAKMEEAMKALSAAMARNKLDITAAWNSGAGLAAVRKLSAEQDRLQAKMDAVTAAAVRQATALQNAAIAGLGSSAVPVGPRDPRAVDIPDYSKLTKNGRIDFAALGASGLKAGKDIQQGGSNGAMGLMMLSQAIDDAQYGKTCRAAA